MCRQKTHSETFQQQGAERECREHSQNSRVTQQQDEAERGQVQ